VTLPILQVDTAHSRYRIDQNNGTYTRTRVHGDAADLSYGGVVDGEPVEYCEILSSLEPGNPLVITHHDGSWIRSTVVQSVLELPAEEAA
jgi:hypothetical protein